LIASVTMTPDERREAARLICEKLSSAKAPVKLIMPLQGIEEWDREGNDLHDAEGIALDAHINDALFAETVLDIFDTWVAEGIIPKA